MYADGMLGNRAIYDSIAPLTTAIFNYIRPEGAAAYKQANIFPWINEYWDNPDYEVAPQEKVNTALSSFMSQAPGFSKERFKK